MSLEEAVEKTEKYCWVCTTKHHCSRCIRRLKCFPDMYEDEELHITDKDYFATN